MGETCNDNRFEIISKAKQDILKSTNISTSPDEMEVLDNFLFRCWQMGWLEKYASEAVPVVHGEWEWFEEWMPSTTENLRECEDCGWRCSQCKTPLEDVVGGYWDNPDEQPKIIFCPNCGAKMKGGNE